MRAKVWYRVSGPRLRESQGYTLDVLDRLYLCEQWGDFEIYVSVHSLATQDSAHTLDILFTTNLESGKCDTYLFLHVAFLVFVLLSFFISLSLSLLHSFSFFTSVIVSLFSSSVFPCLPGTPSPTHPTKHTQPNRHTHTRTHTYTHTINNKPFSYLFPK